MGKYYNAIMDRILIPFYFLHFTSNKETNNERNPGLQKHHWNSTCLVLNLEYSGNKYINTIAADALVTCITRPLSIIAFYERYTVVCFPLKQEALWERRPPPRWIWWMWNSLATRKLVYSQILQDVHCSISGLSWKFHENPFMRFTVMLMMAPKIKSSVS